MIRGITLINFMSYENAYVPLEPGLNVVCGPNGSGKSSLLLAISVVLGQTYTERARRLSDLVRWGADEARVSLLLDNVTREGKRAFQQLHADTITVTRVIRRNGNYYYLVQNRPASKKEVDEAFRCCGINPDNMLIVMHQLMVGRFAAIPPSEKLVLLEEAVGFQSYRRDVLEASIKLRSIESEEQSLATILQSTKETYEFWRREFERYQVKKKLESKLADLRRELKWARIEKKMSALGKIEARIEQRKRALELCESKITENLGASKKREEGFNELKNRRARLATQIVALTKEEARLEADLEWCEKLSKPNIGQESSGGIMREIQGSERQEELLELAGRASQHLERVRKKLSLATEELAHLEDLLERELARLVEAKVELGVNTFRKEMILEELHSLETERRIEKDELKPEIDEALKLGPRFENPRKIMEILIEMSAIEEQLKPLAQLSEDVEKTFGSYAELFEDLKSKAEQVARNRHEIIVELDKRMRRWRDVLEGFLEELSERYNAILSKVGATGSVRLTGTHDITAAGLEILAGFRGGKPTSLDSLTQSGGERSVALMAFLLALQQNIASPFRAIDEFDVHMDPKNREVVSQLIVSIAKELGSQQYIVITPGQITVEEKDVHVLVVQNVDGSSVVSEVT